MAFSVKIQESENASVLKTICLRDEENYEAEIYSFGALLNNFSIQTAGNKINIIEGYHSVLKAMEDIKNGFGSAKLSPFVCRLNRGIYEFDGLQHTIRKHYIKDSAIHGLLFDAHYEVTDFGSDDQMAFVQLQFHYTKKDEGFPFEYLMQVRYSLKERGNLEIISTITNTGIQEMPLSDGWHPYFSLGGMVNDQVLQINADKKMVFNEHLIPTGETEDMVRFKRAEQIGETEMDNCFKLRANASFGLRLSNPANGLELTVHPDASYPYLQIYIPPDCKSIAIECLSSPPDSFNNLIDLIVLQPGATKTFTTNYQISQMGKN